MNDFDIVVTEVKQHEKYEITWGNTTMEVVVLMLEGKSTSDFSLMISGPEEKKEQLFESAKDLRKYLSQYTGFDESTFNNIHGPVVFP